MMTFQQFNNKIPFKKNVCFDANPNSRFQSNKTSNISHFSDIQSNQSE